MRRCDVKYNLIVTSKNNVIVTSNTVSLSQITALTAESEVVEEVTKTEIQNQINIYEEEEITQVVV